YKNVFEYHKALIHIRKTYDGLRLSSKAEINQRFSWDQTTQDATDKALAYKIEGVNGQPTLLIIHAGKVNGSTNVTLNDGKTYMQLTSRAGAQGLFDVEKGLVTRKGNFSVTSTNTTAIFVDVLTTEQTTIKSANVPVVLGSNFNELLNFNILAGAKFYATDI